MARMLRHRVRYFTDGAVIGSKEFVNEALKEGVSILMLFPTVP